MRVILRDETKGVGKEKSKSGFQETGRDLGEDPSKDGMTKSKKKLARYGGD